MLTYGMWTLDNNDGANNTPFTSGRWDSTTNSISRIYFILKTAESDVNTKQQQFDFGPRLS